MLSRPYSAAGQRCRVFLAVGSAGTLFGYSIAASNDAIGPIRQQFLLSSGAVGLVVSSLVAGALAGCLFAARAIDWYGHRRVLAAAGLVAIAGTLIAASASSGWLLVIGRLILGGAVGVTSAVTPVYIGEISPGRGRGTMMAGYQLAIAVGFLLALTAGAIVSLSDHGWRLIFLANAIPAIAQIATVAVVPSSPYRLVAHGRIEDARKSLLRTRPADDVDAELEAILVGHQPLSSTTPASRTSSMRRPVLIAMVAALMNALVGVGAVIYYSTEVFAIAGATGPSGAEMASWSVGVVNVVATVVALGLIHRYGRRPLLTIGLTGIIAALLTAGSALFLGESTVTGAVTIAAILAFMACYAFSAGPIAWLLVTEVLPARIRCRAGAVATGLNWGANLLVALLFPMLVGSPGEPRRVAVGFFVFAALSGGFLLFVRRYVPETKDRSLSELEAHFGIVDTVSGDRGTADVAHVQAGLTDREYIRERAVLDMGPTAGRHQMREEGCRDE